MAHTPAHEAEHHQTKKPETAPLIMPVAEAAPGKPTQTIGVKGGVIEDGARDPDTIAEEQRRRSEEYEAEIAKSKAGTPAKGAK